MDLSGARKAIARARQLEPNNEDFAAAGRYIATLVEMSAVRAVWDAEFDHPVRWVRTEPALGLCWFASQGPGGVERVQVNWRTGDVAVDARGTGWDVVAENDVEFDALERRKPVNTRSMRARLERQIKIARRFGGLGPHFERRPVADARTVNSTWLATVDAGLVVQRHGGEPIRLSSGEASCPTFAPDEKVIAWVESAAGEWKVFISPVTGPPVERATFEACPTIAWLDDSSGLVVLEPKSGLVQVIDRRTGAREIATFSGFVNLRLIPSMKPGEVVVVGHRVIGKDAWLATHLHLRRGAIIEQYELPAGGSEGLLRADGKFALVLDDNRLLVADLPGSRMKLLSTVSVVPGGIRGANWQEDAPLYVPEIIGQTVRLLSLDVDLLCG
jgi:hypothetical protein